MGVDRLGTEIPRCPKLYIPSLLFQRPRLCSVCVEGGWGWDFKSFCPMREVTCQINLSLNFLAPLPYSLATEFRGAEGKLASHFSPSSAEML